MTLNSDGTTPRQFTDYQSESEVLVANGLHDGLEDLELLVPLPAASFATLLGELGFDDVDESTAVSLATEDREFIHHEELALVMTAPSGGQLRAVFIERGAATDEQWGLICGRFSDLAASIGAHFGPEDGWPE